jgi:hypothetical protein
MLYVTPNAHHRRPSDPSLMITRGARADSSGAEVLYLFSANGGALLLSPTSHDKRGLVLAPIFADHARLTGSRTMAC